KMVLGDEVQLIRSGDETAREVCTILYHRKRINDGEEQSDQLFLTTGKIGMFKDIASKLVGQPIEIVKLFNLETEY
ncbi:glutamate racemase, partial [Bacillus mycoides]|nr:glutamate racemase [Bacillus mycoides]